MYNLPQKNKNRFIFIILFFFLFQGCGLFQFQRRENFKDWYIGRPDGPHIYGTFDELFGTFTYNRTEFTRFLPECSVELDESIYFNQFGEEYRQPYFLHFRILRTITNPVGWTVPKRFKNNRCIIPAGNAKSGYIYFAVYYNGIFDNLIPYRVWNSKMDSSDKVMNSIASPIIYMPTSFVLIIYDFVFLLIHDVLKIPVIPFAAIYYKNQDPKNVARENSIDLKKICDSKGWWKDRFNLHGSELINASYKEGGIYKLAVKTKTDKVDYINASFIGFNELSNDEQSEKWKILYQQMCGHAESD